jgi:hypothetical protein
LCFSTRGVNTASTLSGQGFSRPSFDEQECDVVDLIGEHSQGHATREQLLYLARGRAEQIEQVVARAQKLSLAMGIQEEQSECDEAVAAVLWQRSLFNSVGEVRRRGSHKGEYRHMAARRIENIAM